MVGLAAGAGVAVKGRSGGGQDCRQRQGAEDGMFISIRAAACGGEHVAARGAEDYPAEGMGALDEGRGDPGPRDEVVCPAMSGLIARQSCIIDRTFETGVRYDERGPVLPDGDSTVTPGRGTLRFLRPVRAMPDNETPSRDEAARS